MNDGSHTNSRSVHVLPLASMQFLGRRKGGATIMGDIELVVLHIHMGQWDCITGYSNDKTARCHRFLTLWKATPLMSSKNDTLFRVHPSHRNEHSVTCLH